MFRFTLDTMESRVIQEASRLMEESRKRCEASSLAPAEIIVEPEFQLSPSSIL